MSIKFDIYSYRDYKTHTFQTSGDLLDMITPDQIRAARALKGWSQGELAARTGLAVPTIANIEIGKQEPSVKTMDKIMHAFEINGIEFIADRGVQKRQNQTQVFRGAAELERFYEDIYLSLKSNNQEVLVGNVDEREFVKNLGPDLAKRHMDRMVELDAHYKILLCEGDYYFKGVYADYRWVEEKDFQSIPFYVYGDKLAIILWLDEPVIFLIESTEAANVYREKFNGLWKKSIKPPANPKKEAAAHKEIDDFLSKKAGK
jgi:transcriptional regulator with XRE-family HTH domain